VTGRRKPEGARTCRRALSKLKQANEEYLSPSMEGVLEHGDINLSLLEEKSRGYSRDLKTDRFIKKPFR